MVQKSSMFQTDLRMKSVINKIFTWGLLIIGFMQFTPGYGQLNARLMRHMDVSETQAVFVYGGDIWIMPKEGGMAIQLTHSPGEEYAPRFSPDGKQIAYSAFYNGNSDIYLIPVQGGIPKRLTYQSLPDNVVDWHPDGKRILFTSRKELGQRSGNQFYLVSTEGGLPEKLPIPYGELGSFSPDGKQLAYVMRITENYPFKRYRGGLATDIIVFDLTTNSAKRITQNNATDGKPVWVGNSIYFLSDQDDAMRRNIWKYDTQNGQTTQLTNFKDFDIMYMSAGPSDLIFELAGEPYLLDLKDETYKKINAEVISDLSTEMPRSTSVGKYISDLSASPGGKRIAIEARGEIFNVPVKDGYVQNLTLSSGNFDRAPSWSPDGKWIAWWSDKTGENEIWIKSASESGSPRKLTNRAGGFGYSLYWSPDSKSIAFVDEKNDIILLDITSATETKVDNLVWNLSHPGRLNFSLAWSPDSHWLTYSVGQKNANNAIFLYEVASKKATKVTSGYYQDQNPVFSKDGKYLFYLTDRNMQAAYSNLDNTWVYPNTTQVASVPLKREYPSLLKAKNDEVSLEKKEAKDDLPAKIKVTIDLNQFESRMALLPIEPGNIVDLFPFEGKIAFQKAPNTGSSDKNVGLYFYDIEKRETKSILANARWAKITADGEAILVKNGSVIGIVKPEPDQKIDKPVSTAKLDMELIPREEWRQLFADAWRRHRDFFYDPNMHGLDWLEVRKRYEPLIEQARNRWDVTFIISEMNAELSAGHTYTMGGDTEEVASIPTGYLGIDWGLKNGKFFIKKIVMPAPWDFEVRSPLDQPGIDVSEGDYILAVNGKGLDPNKDPYAGLEGLSNKVVSLKISKTGNLVDAKEFLIKTLSPYEEYQLRQLEWIEQNRQMVDKLSGGKLGYIYMSNTSGRGQLELVRHFYGQLDKQGFIIDERYNGGGQLADRFLELLQRPVTYNLHWRHGRDHTNPIKTNTGPMGMLINGSAGSGGDGLPWAFQELKAGPIVGERTLGILVGPATGHTLIDGGRITVPGARLYDNDGHWFWEGYGVSPDFEVWDDPSQFAIGRDPQMEKVVIEVLKLLKDETYKMTPAPALEDRTSNGFKK